MICRQPEYHSAPIEWVSDQGCRATWLSPKVTSPLL